MQKYVTNNTSDFFFKDGVCPTDFSCFVWLRYGSAQHWWVGRCPSWQNKNRITVTFLGLHYSTFSNLSSTEPLENWTSKCLLYMASIFLTNDLLLPPDLLVFHLDTLTVLVTPKKVQLCTFLCFVVPQSKKNLSRGEKSLILILFNIVPFAI